MSKRVVLDNAEKKLVAELYAAATRIGDDLPYTPEFERMHIEFIAKTGCCISLHEFWKAVASAGKDRRLRRKER